MFRHRLSERQRHVHLTDGGHFENLGVYELLRRRCRYIVVCDAGADPEATFGDLGLAVQRARTDLGAQIDISVDDLAAQARRRLMRAPTARARDLRRRHGGRHSLHQADDVRELKRRPVHLLAHPR